MKLKLVVSILVTFLVVALSANYFQNDKLEVIPLTSNDTIYVGKWKNNSEQGIHIKKVMIDNKNMLIVHYNRNLGKNLYITTEINAKIKKNKLIIDIVNKNATDDIAVTNSLSVKVPFDDDWSDVEVYEDGVLQRDLKIK